MQKKQNIDAESENSDEEKIKEDIKYNYTQLM